ncbi:hypothetical protein ACLOJK_027108, partial [Asimina triloba]
MARFSPNCILAVPKQLDPSPWMTPSSVSSASSSPDPDAHQQITLHIDCPPPFKIQRPGSSDRRFTSQ